MACLPISPHRHNHVLFRLGLFRFGLGFGFRLRFGFGLRLGFGAFSTSFITGASGSFSSEIVDAGAGTGTVSTAGLLLCVIGTSTGTSDFTGSLTDCINQYRFFYYVCRLISQTQAGSEKQGGKNCRGSGQERRRTLRAENRPGRAAAEGGAGVGAFTVLHQHQADDAHAQQNMNNDDNLVQHIIILNLIN